MKNEEIQSLAQGNIKSAMNATGATSQDLWMVPREGIRIIEGFNVREKDDPEYQAHIQWLAESIKENGFYRDRPLTGYVGKEDDQDVIFLTDGHSRLAAVDLLISAGVEIGPLPVVTKLRGTSVEDLLVAMYTSNSGKPLTPYETGMLCKRLLGMGWDEKTISKRLGLKSIQYLQDLLDLVGAPLDVRNMVTHGEVSATTAIKVMKEHGSKAVAVLKKGVDQAKSEGKARATPKHMRDKKESRRIAGQEPSSQASGAAQNASGGEAPMKAGIMGDVCKPESQALLFEAAAALEGKGQIAQGRALQAAVLIRQLIREIAGEEVETA